MNDKSQDKRPVPARSSESGFTLVEIMVVIVILGLLATLVARNVMGASDESREGLAKANAKQLADLCREWYSKKGALPESLDELAEKDDKGRVYIDSVPLDPWDVPYEIVIGDTPTDFEVISCGPDKQPDTEDDISSRTRREDN